MRHRIKVSMVGYIELDSDDYFDKETKTPQQMIDAEFESDASGIRDQIEWEKPEATFAPYRLTGTVFRNSVDKSGDIVDWAGVTMEDIVPVVAPNGYVVGKAELIKTPDKIIAEVEIEKIKDLPLELAETLIPSISAMINRVGGVIKKTKIHAINLELKNVDDKIKPLKLKEK